ncbi:MAG: HD domain-containing protein [Desulfobacteraceae bacterium]|nr:HD domain-containing protein [Desulfobacteraceae bacterium]
METKAPNPATLLAGGTAPPVVEFYFELCHLKQLFRQGWLKRGVDRHRCESVADHSFGVAVLAMLIADQHFPGLDIVRVMRLALLHDLGEIHAGDITPEDRVSAEEKLRRERHSAGEVLGRLPNGAAYLELWEELQAGVTPEARFVREIDKLEMALQANIYERFGMGVMGEFYVSAGKTLSDPVLKEILARLLGISTSTS